MAKSNYYIGRTYMDYRFVKLIGEGGMNSEVYLAEKINYTEHSPDRFVAIKIITKTEDTSNDNWNKILDEAVTNARLSKRDDVNIVKLYNYDTKDPHIVKTVMEYMDGPSLKALIRDRGGLSIPETLYFFKKMLIGVQYMHNQDRSIIHRDLKPENILTSKDLIEAKISDFGVCSVIEQVDDKKNYLTNEMNFFGTVPYVTPDAFKTINVNGHKIPIITKQYDFHSLGIIFYEMLFGDKPFEMLDETDTKVIYYYKKYDIIPMKKINPLIRNEIENIFLRLTASKDEDLYIRYNSVEDILKDVEKVELAISQDLPEEKTLKPYNQRVFQNIYPLDLKENNNLIAAISKNKIALSCCLLFCIIFVLFFVLLGLGFIWTP